MNKISLFTCIIFFISCNDNNNEKAVTEQDSADSTPVVVKPASTLGGCYLMVQQKDTAMLKFDMLDSTISGKLQYKRFEKDRNDGNVNGILRDNLIIADYTFQSEGRTSVRQVVFSIKADSLFEGYGEIRVVGDTARFVDINNLKFLPAPFVKTDCALP